MASQGVEVIDPVELLLNPGPKQRKKKVMSEWYEGCTTCKQCGKSFATKSALDVHFRTHTGEKPYQCKLCLRAFTQKAHIKRHALVHHQASNGEIYNCDQCSKSFKDQRAFRRHQNLHLGFDLRYKCQQCDRSYSRPASLTQHMLTHATGYNCKMCSQNFDTFIRLRRHKADFHKKPPHRCEPCNKTFTHLCDLKIHNRKHSEERPYSCEVCSKQFKSVSHVNRHLRTHKDYVPPPRCKYAPCSKCAKSFKTQVEVLMHKCDVEDPLFPFTCAHCDNGYMLKKDIRMHIREHIMINA